MLKPSQTINKYEEEKKALDMIEQRLLPNITIPATIWNSVKDKLKPMNDIILRHTAVEAAGLDDKVMVSSVAEAAKTK